jgi:hypothetical protein
MRLGSKMKNVKNLTPQNRQALLALPVGFPVQVRNLGPVNADERWWDATVARVELVNGELELDLRWFFPGFQSDWGTFRDEWHDWRIYETDCHTGTPHLSTGSAADVTSVRWSPAALAAYRELAADPVLAGAVAGLLA